jgi:hypothetical protein
MVALSRASAAREGGGEASVGVVQAGLLNRETSQIGVPTLSREAEGHVVSSVIASCWGTLRGRRTWACTKLSRLRTGRSHGHPLVLMGGRVVRGRLRP